METQDRKAHTHTHSHTFREKKSQTRSDKYMEKIGRDRHSRQRDRQTDRSESQVQ